MEQTNPNNVFLWLHLWDFYGVTIFKCAYVGIAFPLGTTIKKELGTMSIYLGLPKDHALRATILQYKQRFEEYSDEHIFVYFRNFCRCSL